MFFVRKRSVSSRCFLRESEASAADVGHEGVITGRDGFSLRSSIADPQGVAQSPLQSATSHSMYLLALQQHGFDCTKEERQQQHGFDCAKAKRQRQSAQSERKSTSRFTKESTH
ncbi:hypothetical protein ACQKNB_11875 [Lysinibacillus xylanilyticus]|uniref:hypothetical protein n=1 Tax=Lysinibacillus xylanilyticus TaxID=582475 RepID=UPI003D044DFD